MHDLKLSVATILGRPGDHRDVHIAHVIEGVATALAALEPSPVEGDLRLESVVEGVLVTGRVTATTALQCARCLTGFDSPASVELCELFVSPEHEADDDSYRVQGTDIDVEPMLRDVLALDLPLKPLCKESCKGLCAHCGTDLNTTTCDCTQDDTDPRWAALDELRTRLEA